MINFLTFFAAQVEMSKHNKQYEMLKEKKERIKCDAMRYTYSIITRKHPSFFVILFLCLFFNFAYIFFAIDASFSLLILTQYKH